MGSKPECTQLEMRLEGDWMRLITGLIMWVTSFEYPHHSASICFSAIFYVAIDELLETSAMSKAQIVPFVCGTSDSYTIGAGGIV